MKQLLSAHLYSLFIMVNDIKFRNAFNISFRKSQDDNKCNLRLILSQDRSQVNVKVAGCDQRAKGQIQTWSMTLRLNSACLS